MRTIAYIRVSNDKQVTGSSLENQVARIESYCKSYDMKIIEVISDEGFTGRNQKREGFNRLMDMVSKKECDAVVVYSISRFARDSRDTLNCLKVMEDNNVSFHSYTEKIDTASPHGKFFLTLLAAMAQMESDQISLRVKSVKENNKRNLKTYTAPVYGFDNKKECPMTINEKEMKTVAYIKERIKHISYGKLAKELNDRSEPTKKGKKWHTSTLHGIVNNTVYDNLKVI